MWSLPLLFLNFTVDQDLENSPVHRPLIRTSEAKEGRAVMKRRAFSAEGNSALNQVGLWDVGRVLPDLLIILFRFV